MIERGQRFLQVSEPPRARGRRWFGAAIGALAVVALAGCGSQTSADKTANGGAIELLNVSYDPTREQIGRAACREREGQYVKISVDAVYIKNKKIERITNIRNHKQ